MAGEGIVLQAARGDRRVGTAALRGGPITIGSWSGATLPLDDPDLQPVQVVLDPESDGTWRLISLAPDGCRVNGRAVDRAFVSPGDRIAVGPYELVISDSAPVDRASRPAPALTLAPRLAEQPLRAVLRWRGTPIDACVLAPDQLLSIGHGRRVTFELPDGDRRCWAAAVCLDGTWHVALDTPARAIHADDDRPLLSAEARTDGPQLPRGFIAGKLWAPIPEGAHVRLDAGALSIELERCDQFPLVHVDRLPAWATPEGQRFIIGGLVLITLVAMLRLQVESMVDDDPGAGAAQALEHYQNKPLSEDLKARLAGWQKKVWKPDDGGSAKAKGIEGQAGRPDVTQRQARRAGPRSDAEVVQNQALLRMLASGTTAQLLAGGTLGAATALGHLAGPVVGDAQGALGLGLQGTGSGGGGLSGDTVGVGPVGTGGVGLGTAGKVGKVGRGGQSDLGIDEPASVQGGLDREVIRRVILSHRAQIRYCYEKQLSVTPDLAGKVLVEFVIAGDGSVTTARPTEQTLSDAEVGRCIVSKVKTWTFPQPKGNGVVVVTYPFLFKPAGQGAH